MGATRASVTAVVAVVGGVLVVAVLVTWAASIGPGAVLQGEGPRPERITLTEPSSLDIPTSDEPDPEAGRDEGGTTVTTVLRLLFLVLGTALAVALIFLLQLGARRAWEAYDARRRPPPPPEEVEFDVLETPRRVAEEIGRDATGQRQALQRGNPRNGIVECWHRFERQAAEAGFERKPWETSSEFTLRMLDLVAADSHAVAELAQLYREARFSVHPLDEEARRRAVAALDAVHAGLLPGVGGGR